MGEKDKFLLCLRCNYFCFSQPYLILTDVYTYTLYKTNTAILKFLLSVSVSWMKWRYWRKDLHHQKIKTKQRFFLKVPFNNPPQGIFTSLLTAYHHPYMYFTSMSVVYFSVYLDAKPKFHSFAYVESHNGLFSLLLPSRFYIWPVYFPIFISDTSLLV